MKFKVYDDIVYPCVCYYELCPMRMVIILHKLTDDAICKECNTILVKVEMN